MRILLLTPRLPWPPIDGGRIAMSRLAQSLANAGAEVEILSLNPRKHHGDVRASPLPLQAVDIETSRLALSREAPFLVARFVSSKFREALHATLARFRPDIVQIESPFLLPYAKDIQGPRVALRSLNVEFRIWEGLARNERNPIRRLALRRILFSLCRYEVQHLNTPDALIPISADDAADFRGFGCTRPIHVVPCGVTLSDLSPVQPEPRSVGFIGSLDFRPNQEAVAWIVDELWPRITDARLYLAGSSPPAWLRRRAAGKNIEFLGHVPDAEAFLRRMSVVIAPLFAGGGMRIKVLEAMALAKPIVATSLGAGGIDVTPGRDILLAEDAPSFAEAVNRLLREPETAARLGAAARATVGERYDSDALGRELLAFYEKL